MLYMEDIMQNLLIPLGLILVSGLLIYTTMLIAAKRDRGLELELLEQGKAHLQELGVAIFDWLGLLQLPTLADQTKREAAAHRLSIALVERLMLQRVHYCHPNTNQK